MCFSPQGPHLKSTSSQKSYNLSYLYSLLQSLVLSSSGKNPDSESWKLKSPVSSLNFERRQAERLALEKWGFHFSHFTFSQDNLKMSVSSIAKLHVFVLTILLTKTYSLVSCSCSTDKLPSLYNFMGSVTFLIQKVRIGSGKEKSAIPKAGLLDCCLGNPVQK